MLPQRMEQIVQRIRAGETTTTDAANAELLFKALGYVLESYLSDGNVWRAVAQARQVWRQLGGGDDEEVDGE